MRGNPRGYLALRKELDQLFEDLKGTFASGALPTMSIIIQALCRSIQQEINVAAKFFEKSSVPSTEGTGNLSPMTSLFANANADSRQLNMNPEMWRTANEPVTDTLLATLRPSDSAVYDSEVGADLGREGCLPDTCVNILSNACSWANDIDASPVYWLTGMSGTGKTTIAYSLCTQLKDSSTLAASFFCSRLVPECRDAPLVIPSLAHQLAKISRPFRAVLIRNLQNDPSVQSRSLALQFRALISEPLFEVQSTFPDGLVVVIDALDECEDQSALGQLVGALASNAQQKKVKFFITSRAKPEIFERMMAERDSSPRVLLHDLDFAPTKDIRIYVQNKLSSMSLTPSEIDALVERSNSLFICAATIVRYIGQKNSGDGSRSRLDEVLSISPSDSLAKGVDEVYRLILRASFNNDPSEDIKGDMRRTLDTVLCAQECLNIDVLSKLLGLKGDYVGEKIHLLWPVLRIQRSRRIAMDASFLDFISDQHRSGEYYSNPQERNRTLAKLCLDCINDQARFNICDLESSYPEDKDAPDFANRVQRAISAELSYASRYWTAHLSLAGSSDGSDLSLLEQFLSIWFLLWVEILNLKGVIREAVEMMQLVEKWALDQRCSNELSDLVHDARLFVTAFASRSVSRSTPHLYISMLPSWPGSNPIAKHYAGQIQKMITLEGTPVTDLQLGPLDTWNMAGEITALSVSPDGLSVAVSVDRVIHILDARTGRIINRMTGHVGRISSLSFSPDATRIVSGAYDDTIRVWSISTGLLILGPLREHTYVVTSVDFYPDGTLIASGSRDKTIRVWDSFNGRMMLVLEGHTDSITSVRFSHDGKLLASGSHDCTIRVWGFPSGEVVHVCEITSPLLGPALFSPDGYFVIYASKNDMGLLDFLTGANIGNLEGHDGLVTAIAISPDGTIVASGSEDGTICVWDTRTGKKLVDLFRGHEPVNSVAFSPDGVYIISGSGNAVRTWDPHRGIDLVQGYMPKITPDRGEGSALYGLDDRALQEANLEEQKQPSKVSISTSTKVEWKSKEDGWVVDNQNRLLIWIPPEFIPALMPPTDTSSALPRGRIRLIIDDAKIGNSWVECYKGASLPPKSEDTEQLGQGGE
ncbi:hypothetical protein FRC11_013429 [Ceratobasidium sp. 423]|nr:hypothetical protein FRC11_013429 [Ceratobasidium sp. 423]